MGRKGLKGNKKGAKRRQKRGNASDKKGAKGR